MGGWRGAAVAALTAAVLAGCSLMPPVRPVAAPGEMPGWSASNESQLEITLVVNGVVVAVVAPKSSVGPATVALPPLPWSIEARTASGRVVGTSSLPVGGGRCVDTGDGGRSCTGALLVATFVCGGFIFWAGEVPPSLPSTMPGAGEPCVP